MMEKKMARIHTHRAKEMADEQIRYEEKKVGGIKGAITRPKYVTEFCSVFYHF